MKTLSFVSTCCLLVVLTACKAPQVPDPTAAVDAVNNAANAAKDAVVDTADVIEDTVEDVVEDVEDMVDDMNDDTNGDVQGDTAESDLAPSGYADFTADVIGNGETSLLFFHASWCPTCVAKDKTVTSLYAAADLPISTYKVDFDSAGDLKSKYNVVMQDTFVLVDGNGDLIKLMAGPNEAALKAALMGEYGGIVEADSAEPTDGDADDEVAMAKGEYTAYSDGVIGNGKKSLLFFHATWCPKCKENNTRLLGYYEGDVPVSTYKIDYDSADDLKAQFNVVQQDTFILLDGEGNELDRFSFPSEDKLKSAIDFS